MNVIATKGRVVLVRVQQPNQFDDGNRTALVTGNHKKGISVVIFPDCTADPAQPPGLGTVLYRHSLKYGDGTYNWRWPRDDQHEAEMLMGEEDNAPARELTEEEKAALSAAVEAPGNAQTVTDMGAVVTEASTAPAEETKP